MTRVATENGSSFSCTNAAARSLRTRSISAFGKVACSATSAKSSRTSGKFRVSACVPTSELSIEARDQNDAPKSAERSAICNALRVVVPCWSMRAVKLARPGLSGGFAPLPERSTRLAATSGRPGRSLYSTVKPFESLNSCGTGKCSGLDGPGFGGSLRHSASVLTGSPPIFAVSFASDFGVGTSAPRSCLPGTPYTTTR